VLLTACAAPRDGAELEDFPAAPPRPRDPWVLRCVLDGHPRMLVIALSDDLWLAYDTTTCTLAKAWHGDVNFDGPVYTTVHGPQPTTRGEDLHDPLSGSTWEFGPISATRTTFRGYSLHEGHVTFTWDLVDDTPLVTTDVEYGDPPEPRASVATVRETPEVVRDGDGRITLMRRFEVVSVSEDAPTLRRGLWQEERTAPRFRCDGTAHWLSAWVMKPAGESLELGCGPELGYGLRLDLGTGDFEVTYDESVESSSSAEEHRP